MRCKEVLRVVISFLGGLPVFTTLVLRLEDGKAVTYAGADLFAPAHIAMTKNAGKDSIWGAWCAELPTSSVPFLGRSPLQGGLARMHHLALAAELVAILDTISWKEQFN